MDSGEGVTSRTHGTGLVAGKGQRGFDFCVERKAFRSRKIDSAARAIQMIRALLGAAKRRGNAVSVSEEKVGGVNKYMAILLGCIGDRFAILLGGNGEAPKRRLRERIVDSTALIHVVGHRAIAEILLNEENFRPAALEPDDGRFAELAAVEADVIRADARREPALVEEFRLPLIDFEPQLTLLGVPIQIEIAGKLLRAGDFFGDRRRLGRGRLARWCLGRIGISRDAGKGQA